MPTQIRYISVKGRPQMQVITENPVLSVRVYRKWGRKLKRINDNTFQVPAAIGYDFFDINKESFGSYFSATIAEGSLSHYYGFNDLYSNCYRCSTELTEKFVQMFSERGDTMIRHEMNITNDATNNLGMKMPDFEHRLYENSMYDAEVGDFTEDEFQCFVNALGDDCGIVNDIRKKIISQNMEDTDVESIEREIVRFENKINDILKSLSSEIEMFKSSLPSRSFDCGFTIIETNDQNLKEKYKTLKDHEKRTSDKVSINFPDDYFSCSKSDKILEFIKENTDDTDIKNLYVRTVLD